MDWKFERVRIAWFVQNLILMASVSTVRITKRRGDFGAETGGLEEHAKKEKLPKWRVWGTADLFPPHFKWSEQVRAGQSSSPNFPSKIKGRGAARNAGKFCHRFHSVSNHGKAFKSQPRIWLILVGREGR
jgi:hypothetical protein